MVASFISIEMYKFAFGGERESLISRLLVTYSGEISTCISKRSSSNLMLPNYLHNYEGWYERQDPGVMYPNPDNQTINLFVLSYSQGRGIYQTEKQVEFLHKTIGSIVNGVMITVFNKRSHHTN